MTTNFENTEGENSTVLSRLIYVLSIITFSVTVTSGLMMVKEFFLHPSYSAKDDMIYLTGLLLAFVIAIFVICRASYFIILGDKYLVDDKKYLDKTNIWFYFSAGISVPLLVACWDAQLGLAGLLLGVLILYLVFIADSPRR